MDNFVMFLGLYDVSSVNLKCQKWPFFDIFAARHYVTLLDPYSLFYTGLAPVILSIVSGTQCNLKNDSVEFLRC